MLVGKNTSPICRNVISTSSLKENDVIATIASLKTTPSVRRSNEVKIDGRGLTVLSIYIYYIEMYVTYHSSTVGCLVVLEPTGHRFL